MVDTTSHRELREQRRLRPARTALRRALAAWAETAVTLVVAPAGYGKTTAVDELVEELDRRAADCCRLRLTAADDVPEQLLLTLAQVTEAVGPAAVVVSMDGLDAAVQHLCAAWATTERPTLIILDDLQAVAAPATLGLLNSLIEQAPTQVHWLLISRERPELPLTRWQLAQQLREIGPEAFQLTVDEVAALIGQHGLTAGAGAAEQLAAWIDGWIVALQLTLPALRGDIDGVLRAADVDAALQVPPNALIDYVNSELLGQIPADLSDFLRQCPLLTTLSVAACRSVSGRDDAGALLAEGLRRRLVSEASTGQPGQYEIPRLLRAVLTEQLRRSATNSIRSVVLRTAGWYVDNGAIDDALQVLIDFGFIDEAVALLEQQLRAAMLDGRYHMMAGWLQQLPVQQIRGRPTLTVAAGWAAFHTTDFGGLQELAPLLAPIADTADKSRLRSEAQALLGALRLLSGAISGLCADLLTMQAQLPAQEHYARAWLFCLAAAARPPQDSSLPDELWLVQQAGDLFHACGSRAGVLTAQALQLGLLRHRLQLHEAVQIGRAGLVGCAELGDAQARQLFTLEFTGFTLEACLLTGELSWAAELAATALADAGRNGDVHFQLQALIWSDIVTLLSGAADDSVTAERSAEAALWQRGLANETEGVVATRVLWQTMRSKLAGRRPDAARLTGPLISGIDASLAARPSNVILATAAAHLTFDRHSAALIALLEALVNAEQATVTPYVQLWLQLLLASAQYRSGRHGAARTQMRRALATIRRQRLSAMLRFFPELAPVVRSLSIREAGQIAEQMTAMAAAHPADQPSGRAAELIPLLVNGTSITQIAAQLHLSSSTVKAHLRRLYRQLGVTNRSEAVVRLKQQDGRLA